jgi:hypothetical protein
MSGNALGLAYGSSDDGNNSSGAESGAGAGFCLFVKGRV